MFTHYRHLLRIIHINRILIKYGLDEFLAPTPFAPYRKYLRWLALKPHGKPEGTKGERLRKALTELGPIFIKFGQMLSTRLDLLPYDIAKELALLQDQVSPFSTEEALDIIQTALNQPLDNLFTSIDTKPLASASIAQVHTATLHDGQSVVIKVIRPNIRKRLKQDIELLYHIVSWFNRYNKHADRINAHQVVQEYEVSLFNEIDLRVEAANTMQLRRNFENNALLYVPEVFWEFTREKVMVQEKISGIPISDVKRLKAAQVDMKVLAHRGVEIFFTQVFRDSFFHADMHPGNIFVDITHPKEPTYIAVDCGIIGTLNQQDKRYLAENFLAFFEQDYRRIAELHISSGWVDQNVSVEAFEAAIRTACEPIFGKPLEEISFGHLLIELFQVAQRFKMVVQPQLILLQKTLLYIEGLGRQLYPQLNLWDTAQPFLKQWYKEQISPKTIFNRCMKKLPVWLEEFPDMPEKLANYLEQSKQQNQASEIQTTLQKTQLLFKHQQQVIRLSVLMLSLTLVSMTLLILNKPAPAFIVGILAAMAYLLSGRKK